MQKKYLKYIGGLAASLALASCSNELTFDYEADSSYNDEPVEITFDVSAESLGLSTRAVTGAGVGGHQTISQGEKIDMLLYAVYMDETEKKEDGTLSHTYTLLTQYAQGLIGINSNENSGNISTFPFTGSETALVNGGDRKGQTIINVGNLFKDGGNLTITLRLMRKQNYTIVFWAQSSKSDAYDTNNLRLMEVNYDKAVNSDEYRDAFCKSESFSVGTLNATRDVILNRPFAQINVATTGADYKYMKEGNDVFTNKTYEYAKMELYGVAKYMDLVTDKILTEKELEEYASNPEVYNLSSEKAASLKDAAALVDVTFDWGTITSYVNGKEEEEFLFINLDNHGMNGHLGSGNDFFLGYKEDYPTLDKEGKPLTETFKYLSMAYVLVPSEKKYSGNSYIYSNAVLKKVGIAFAENENGSNNEIGGNTVMVEGLKYLDNVPVQRNWRTNILGGLTSETTNTTSKSIFSFTDVQVQKTPLYEGDNLEKN